MTQHSEEVQQGERFTFGKNWQRYLEAITPERIAIAEASLRDMLGLRDLDGRRFLDVGSGSGLFSLAARRLGATVHSLDYDPESVACTRELKARFRPDDSQWTIDEGSVLDRDFMASLGDFDIVYSWGVLHHTGDLETALDNARLPLAPSGILWIAIYNDRGPLSKFWGAVKRLYCSGTPGRLLVLALCIPYYFLLSVAIGVIKHGDPTRHFTDYKKDRGMSVYYDWLDWLGGHPYETATVDELVLFYGERGLEPTRLEPTQGLGCHELVFRRPEATGEAP